MLTNKNEIGLITAGELYTPPLRIVDNEPTGDIAISRPPLLCRWSIFGVTHHHWVLLPPSKEQQMAACQLLTHGEGDLRDIGARPEAVYDRACPRCSTAEPRFGRWIETLRRARGSQ